MLHYNTENVTTESAIASRDEALAQLERARQERDFAQQAVTVVKDQLDQSGLALRLFKETTQEALSGFSDDHLFVGDTDYAALSDLMVELGLEGLKRSFTVTVRVTYEFDVDIEAASDDEARDIVDNDIYQYAQDNVDVGNPDDSEFEVNEN